jgi:predicted transcriptional regulator
VTLGEWLKANKKTQAWLAKRAGTGQANICRYVAGKVIPKMATIDRFSRITHGAVNYPDWVNNRRK